MHASLEAVRRLGPDLVSARRVDRRWHPDDLRALEPSVTDWTPVRSPRFETRWFVEGDLPRRLRPAARSAKRVDSYHAASLSPDVSVKLRGDTKWLESKTRSGAEVTTVLGVHAVVERWQKWRADGKQPRLLPGPWIPVRKQVWSLDGLEVARITIDDSAWWTLAFPVDGGRPSCGPLADRWLGHVRDVGVPSSYASWLVDRLAVSHAA
jgi:hypothetical protein